MAKLDVVIKGGMVFDGTGVQRYRADVGIRDGVVAEIGTIAASDARRVVDASGHHVAPGFVDLHTHYDAQVFWDPYCTLSGWHGVTSAVIGNCGFGFAPVRPEERERAMRTMTRVEAIPLASMQQGMPWDWVTFPEFLDSLERTPKAINLLPYVPLAPLLNWVLGLDDAKAGRLPTAAEHDELCRLLDEAMEAGGCGWSAQRLPQTGPACVQRDFDGTAMATDVMDDETCLALTDVLARGNEGFIQVTLASGDFEHDMAHIEELARRGGRPVLFNVVQAFDHLPGAHRTQIAWLERCRRQGLRVYGQGVTTGAGSPSPSRSGTCSTTPRRGARRRPAPSPSASTSWLTRRAATRSRRDCRSPPPHLSTPPSWSGPARLPPSATATGPSARSPPSSSATSSTSCWTSPSTTSCAPAST